MLQPSSTQRHIHQQIPTTRPLKSTTTITAKAIMLECYNVIMLECTLCNKQYVGKAETQFNIRINNYRYRIQTASHNNLLPVEVHFRSTRHDFNRHVKFTIIEKMIKHIPNRTTQILLQHENKWIKHLNTLLPHGFKCKLIYLTNN